MEMMEEKTGKRIWLVNQYAMPPRLESRLRTIKFAHYLQTAIDNLLEECGDCREKGDESEC